MMKKALALPALLLALILAGCTNGGEFTRSEMNKKLKALANNLIPVIETPGAMCYSVVMLTPVACVCDSCGEEAAIDGWVYDSIDTIRTIVSDIKAEGHDVFLEVDTLCENCSEEGKPVLRVSFGIKFADDTDYHMSESTIPSDYRVLLAFLRGERSYKDEYDAVVALKEEERAVIKKMTGLTYGK